jgi:hypothetical protein
LKKVALMSRGAICSAAKAALLVRSMHKTANGPARINKLLDRTSTLAATHAGLAVDVGRIRLCVRGISACVAEWHMGSHAKLMQPVSDLGEARIGARFILVAARRPADADSADRFVADPSAVTIRVLYSRGIERAWRGEVINLTDGARRRNPRDRPGREALPATAPA